MSIKLRLQVAATLCLASLPVHAQPPTPASVLGQITSVDAASRSVVLKAEDGTTLAIALAEKGTVVKVAPGEKSLQNAAPIELSGIAVGDRVLVRGGLRKEGRIDGALRVVVMAKTDLLARDANEQRAWRERGVSGTVAATNAAKGEFTLKVSALPAAGGPPAGNPAPVGPTTVLVEAEKAVLHRYADTSVKYDDAKPATVADMADGDQVRILGTKSEDGSKLLADKVVFGSFKTMALTIEKIDPATGLLSVKDLESNKKFTISLVAGGSIRKIPAEMGAMLATTSGASGGRPGGPRHEGVAAAGNGAPPAGGRPEGARGSGQGQGQGGAGGGAFGMGGGHGPGGEHGQGGFSPGGGGPRGGRGMEDMVERMPAITLKDLKKDDWVGAVVGKIDASGRATAFNILAGIEVFASRANRSGGVDVGMPSGLLDGAFGVPD